MIQPFSTNILLKSTLIQFRSKCAVSQYGVYVWEREREKEREIQLKAVYVTYKLESASNFDDVTRGELGENATPKLELTWSVDDVTQEEVGEDIQCGLFL